MPMPRSTRGQMIDGFGENAPGLDRCTFCGNPRGLVSHGDKHVCRGCIGELRTRFLTTHRMNLEAISHGGFSVHDGAHPGR
jgi:hypothetical protein